MEWQPIETAPQDGYMLVYEDGAIRALFRSKGKWEPPNYPALVSSLWPQNVLVGEDAARVLAPLGFQLAVRDGCCEEPTHWMELPQPPRSLEAEEHVG